MAVLALLVSVSNISLIIHEGRRPANLLGFAIRAYTRKEGPSFIFMLIKRDRPLALVDLP